MEDSLEATAVLPQLVTRWLGRPYHYYETITSTNDWLKALAEQSEPGHLPAGALLLADYQSAGRGRLQRRWESPPGASLMFSLLFRPDWPPAQVTWLTMLACLAATEAAEAALPASVRLGIKWPNDLMLWQDGLWRKWGGLLLEGSLGENGRSRHIILGIGLNVNLTAGQLPEAITPPTSLALAVGQPLSRQRLLLDLLPRLEQRYEQAQAGQSPQPAWRARLITLGQTVSVTRPGQPSLRGLAYDVDEWGQLLLQTEAGDQLPIAAGDVSLR